MIRVELGIREIILCPDFAVADKTSAEVLLYGDNNGGHMGGLRPCSREGEDSGGPSRGHPPCVSTSGSPGGGDGPGVYTVARANSCAALSSASPRMFTPHTLGQASLTLRENHTN